MEQHTENQEITTTGEHMEQHTENQEITTEEIKEVKESEELKHLNVVDTTEVVNELKKWMKTEVLPQIIASNKKTVEVKQTNALPKQLDNLTVSDIEKIIKGTF